MPDERPGAAVPVEHHLVRVSFPQVILDERMAGADHHQIGSPAITRHGASTAAQSLRRSVQSGPKSVRGLSGVLLTTVRLFDGLATQ